MADFFKGLAGGLETGARFGQMLREGEERKRLREAMGLTPQEMQQRQATPEEFGRAQAETQALAAQDAQEFGLTPSSPNFRMEDLPAGVSYAPQMPVEGQRIGPTQFGLGGQTFNRMPTQQEIESARYNAAAGVIAERDPLAAMRMRQDQTRAERDAQLAPLQLEQLRGSIAGQAQARDLVGLQIDTAKRAGEREVGFNTAFDEINKTEYKTPAERDAAVLNAVERFRGPEAKAALQANYSTNERNKILTEGAKFDQTIKQARLKGPSAALKAIDDLNDSFKLEIDGFNVTQVNNDGTRVPFLQARNAEEFALGVDSRIKDGGAFELAKFRQDEQTNIARIEYFKAQTEKAKREGGAAANQLSGVTIGYSRDDKGNPIQVISGLRFNKTTGALESVQVPLQQNVVPASALDPKKIAEQAEALIGQPVDPTNKKSKVVHTFATAQQAVVDQIFNQYLGTGGSAGGLDLSPTAIAQRMLSGQPTPAAAATTAAPRQTGSMGVDTSRPRTDVNPVTGVPREAPVQAPNLVEAASLGLDAGQARYVSYLESKIASGQQLTRDEAVQARRFGLQ